MGCCLVKFAAIASGIIPLFDLLIEAGICSSDTCIALRRSSASRMRKTFASRFALRAAALGSIAGGISARHVPPQGPVDGARQHGGPLSCRHRPSSTGSMPRIAVGITWSVSLGKTVMDGLAGMPMKRVCCLNSALRLIICTGLKSAFRDATATRVTIGKRGQRTGTWLARISG